VPTGVREGDPGPGRLLRSGKCGGNDRYRVLSRPVPAVGVARGPVGVGGGANSLRRMERIAVLGGGRMGTALARGLLDGGTDADQLAVAESDPSRRRDLEAELPGVRIAPSVPWVVADADVVVVAVKPGDVVAVLEAGESSLGADALVISIAAGVPLDALERAVPGRPVVRAMPNTPALVREGVAAVAAGAKTDESHVAAAMRLLGSVGAVVEVSERLMDAVTGLSGSGPAYIFLVAEAMIEAGVLNGLPRDVATTLVHGTIRGAGVMLTETGESAETLRAAVTSPGGTTAAGLQALEQGAVRAAVVDAVTAATERSRELGASKP
jgi:pyrroline-5-carboxylate reductase